jgi:hypothetical protein
MNVYFSRISAVRIETGRYVGKEPERRICTLCDMNTVEDEKHFLLKRKLYDEIRLSNQKLESQFTSLNTTAKIITWLNHFPRKVSQYLVQAYHKRSIYIYNK